MKLQRKSTNQRLVTNFLKDLLTYRLGKRTSRGRKVEEHTKTHILRAASNKTISCSNIIHDLSLKISRWTINRVTKKLNILTRNHLHP